MMQPFPIETTARDFAAAVGRFRSCGGSSSAGNSRIAKAARQLPPSLPLSHGRRARARQAARGSWGDERTDEWAERRARAPRGVPNGVRDCAGCAGDPDLAGTFETPPISIERPGECARSSMPMKRTFQEEITNPPAASGERR
jgi:hypothetical protein